VMRVQTALAVWWWRNITKWWGYKRHLLFNGGETILSDEGTNGTCCLTVEKHY